MAFLRLQRNSKSQKEKHPDTFLALAGYTDKYGSNEYNQTLSEKRALSVKNYLIKLGIPKERIITVEGFGKTMLLPEMTNRENRRVTILSAKSEKQ